MKPPTFEYVRAESVDEAVAVLAEHGDEAKVLAGGQSLVPMLNMRLTFPAVILDVNRLAGLAGIDGGDGTVRVGALVRQAAFERSPLVGEQVPAAAACMTHVGHLATRNRGTIGGSLAHADSRGELPVVLSLLDGSVVAASARGRREIAAGELFVTHYTTALQPDELLIESRWPVAENGWGFAFEEFSPRHGDYALAMVAAALQRVDGRVAAARLAVGAVGDRPAVLDGVAAGLHGMAVDVDAARAMGAAAAAAVEADGDLHASAEYRRHLVGVLTARAVTRAWSDAAERGAS